MSPDPRRPLIASTSSLDLVSAPGAGLSRLRASAVSTHPPVASTISNHVPQPPRGCLSEVHVARAPLRRVPGRRGSRASSHSPGLSAGWTWRAEAPRGGARGIDPSRATTPRVGLGVEGRRDRPSQAVVHRAISRKGPRSGSAWAMERRRRARGRVGEAPLQADQGLCEPAPAGAIAPSPAGGAPGASAFSLAGFVLSHSRTGLSRASARAAVSGLPRFTVPATWMT